MQTSYKTFTILSWGRNCTSKPDLGFFIKMKDTMIFYRSFYEALKELNESDRLAIYDAIFSYGLDQIEPQLN